MPQKHRKQRKKKKRTLQTDFLSNPLLIRPLLFQLWVFLDGLPASRLAMVNRFWRHCFWSILACCLPRKLKLQTYHLITFPTPCASQITDLELWRSTPDYLKPQRFALFSNLEHLHLDRWVLAKCDLSLLTSSVRIHIHVGSILNSELTLENLPSSLLQVNDEYEPKQKSSWGIPMQLSVEFCMHLKHISFGSVNMLILSGSLPMSLESLALPDCHSIKVKKALSLPNLTELNIGSSCLHSFSRSPSLTRLCVKQMSFGENVLFDSPMSGDFYAVKQLTVTDPCVGINQKIGWMNLQALTLDFEHYGHTRLPSFAHLSCLSSLQLLHDPTWIEYTSRWRVEKAFFPTCLKDLTFIGCALQWEPDMTRLTCLTSLQLFECQLDISTHPLQQNYLPKNLSSWFSVGDNRHYYVEKTE